MAPIYKPSQWDYIAQGLQQGGDAFFSARSAAQQRTDAKRREDEEKRRYEQAQRDMKAQQVMSLIMSVYSAGNMDSGPALQALQAQGSPLTQLAPTSQEVRRQITMSPAKVSINGTGAGPAWEKLSVTPWQDSDRQFAGLPDEVTAAISSIKKRVLAGDTTVTNEERAAVGMPSSTSVESANALDVFKGVGAFAPGYIGKINPGRLPQDPKKLTEIADKAYEAWRTEAPASGQGALARQPASRAAFGEAIRAMYSQQVEEDNKAAMARAAVIRADNAGGSGKPPVTFAQLEQTVRTLTNEKEAFQKNLIKNALLMQSAKTPRNEWPPQMVEAVQEWNALNAQIDGARRAASIAGSGQPVTQEQLDAIRANPGAPLPGTDMASVVAARPAAGDDPQFAAAVEMYSQMKKETALAMINGSTKMSQAQKDALKKALRF